MVSGKIHVSLLLLGKTKRLVTLDAFKLGQLRRNSSAISSGQRGSGIH